METCRMIADLLERHGVRRVVTSPGSRNAPLVSAVCRLGGLEVMTVIDERSASFVALGLSLQSDSPVALICTSGTAVLNYAPGVAEAYYRGVPLIVISADRPAQWIDQDDSQTIRQAGVLDHIVKASYTIDADTSLRPDGPWLANRLVNDALLNALEIGRRGPVHINVALDLGQRREGEYGRFADRVIRVVKGREELSREVAQEIAREVGGRKTLIIAGFNSRPTDRLNRSLRRLARRRNFVVMTETIANLHGREYLSRIDTALSGGVGEELSPELVITVGGALVSRHIKEYIRGLRGVEHWHVGLSHTTVDCFRHLSKRIEIEPSTFFSQLGTAMSQTVEDTGDFSARWHSLYKDRCRVHDEYMSHVGWSEMQLFRLLIDSIPNKWNVHFSNGTPIRYAQLMDCSHLHRTECNRGVSGIDGSTSTALGASIAYSGVTLLVTGDMSAQYDIGALSSTLFTPRFKMVVVNNGGGGIFRFVKTTSDLPERDARFVVGTRLPIIEMGEALGFGMYHAEDGESFATSFKAFAAERERPAIMVVDVPGEMSAEILKKYFTIS